MKVKKRLLSVITAVLCILSMVMPVSAADVPRVTFDNSKNTTPDLYITKQVRSADDRYEMPDTEFGFVLKLNGALAREKQYRVFDEDGQEVFNYDDTTGTNVKVPFETTRSGNFTLLGGQTARFEYVGEGVQYEVTEDEAEGWTQVTPAAGVSLKGTVAAEGTTATFVNEYQPSSAAAQTAQLKVVKNISFPAGYELPEAAADDEFSYTLTLAGKPYASQPYTVTDNATGNAVSEGVTDADGRFTLPGNCTATFKEVTTEQDYEITEDPAEGWRVVGSDTRRGAVKAPATTEYYTNVQASFLVSKSVRGGDPADDGFIFTLMDNRSREWAGAQYYLYNADGTLADQTLRATDAKGAFALKSGQAALFVGIPSGTAYQVREDAAAGYIQRVPVNAEGYRDMVVTDSVEELTFVNEKEEDPGRLTVTKRVASTNGDQPLSGDVFNFILTTDDGVPVSGAVYAIAEGSGESTYETGKDGSFSLKANQTARFRDLPEDGYKVKEVLDADGEYANEQSEQTGALGPDGLALVFTNSYTPKVLTDIHIMKTDTEGKALEGAKFALYTNAELEDPIAEETTDNGGEITFTGLKLGTYYLKETEAPEGYLTAEKAMKIELSRVNREEGFKLKVDGQEYGEGGDGAVYFEQDGEDTQTVYLTIENKEKADIRYNFGNSSHPEITLPETDSVEKGTTGFDPADPADHDDYIFDGWYYDPDYEEAYDPDKPIDEDLDLYGKWTRKTVTVTYEWADPEQAPDGQNPPEEEIVYKNEAYTAQGMTTVENWIFKGWYTDKECTSKYVDGTYLQSDLVLYGKWEQTDFVITAANLTAYTGGDSLNGDSFPTARYVVGAAEGIDITEYTFRTADGQEFEVAELGTEMTIPELQENYIYAATDEDLEDDSLAGIYDIEAVNAPVTAVDGEGNEVNVTYVSGQLIVRHVSDEEAALEELHTLTTPVVSTEPSRPVETPTAVIEEGSLIRTNGRDELGLLGTEDEGASIALFHDAILGEADGDTSRSEMLRNRAMELIREGSIDDYNIELVYLDLVNTNDGNVWVSSSKGSTVYLPYPEGTDRNTDFGLIHYKGLHREYGIGRVQDVVTEIAEAELEAVKIEKTDEGIRFFIPESGFSPFGLVWAKDSGDVPVKPGDATTPDDGQIATPTTNQGIVRTGDDTAVWPWVAAAAAAAAVIAAGIAVYRRRRTGR